MAFVVKCVCFFVCHLFFSFLMQAFHILTVPLIDLMLFGGPMKTTHGSVA